MEQNAGIERARKPRWGTLLLIVLGHLIAVVLLARAFAPDFTASVVKEATAVFTVTITTAEDDPPPPAPEPAPDEGAAGEEAPEAKPRPVAAPKPPLPVRPTPAPRASSIGAETQSGAGESGAGTGGAASGEGTGSGQSGSGQGGGVAVRAVKIAGDINSASDYPVPPGGRQARFGTSVTIALTVGTDGRPTACRVHSRSPFPETDATTCRLAMERFRFRPATDRNGNPIISTYGWRQEFRESP